jgi:hypothetical protein
MAQMTRVMLYADSEERTILYCWPSPLDFSFLAAPRADCIIRYGQQLSGLPSDHREATIIK